MSSAPEVESAPRATAGSPAGWAEHFTVGRVCLVIALFLLALYPGVLLGSHSFFCRDFGLFTYPVAYYTHESFWRGEVPLWNPLINSGVPFLAQWNTTVCYPLSLVYMLLPLPWSLNYFCLGHLMLAGAGMYALAFRWTQDRFAAAIAAIAFALSGLMLNSVIWTSNLAALSWQPLVILCVERAWRQGGRSIGLAALVGAMQMLAGAPEIILFTWLILGALWITAVLRKTIRFGSALRRMVAVVGLVAALSAVQLLPFFDLLRHSERDAASQIADAWPMPLWGWANLVVPLFHSSRTRLGFYFQDGQSWTTSYYLGIGVLALALVGVVRTRDWNARWLAVAAVLGMVLALGTDGQVYRWLKAIFPAIGFARYPIKFVAIPVFAVPLLAAYGFVSFKTTDRRKSERLLLGAGVLLLGGVALTLLAAHQFQTPGESWAATSRSGIMSAGFLVAILFLTVVTVRAPSAQRGGMIGLAVLLLLGLDAITAGSHQNPTVATQAFGPLELNMSSRPRFGESRAMVSGKAQAFFMQADTADPLGYYLAVRGALFKNCNLLEGIPKPDGFSSLHLKEEAEVESRLRANTNALANRLADFAGVAQISAPDDVFSWQPRKTFLPLLTAGQQPVFCGPAETLQRMSEKDFDPLRTVFLPVSAGTEVTATRSESAKVSAQSFSAQRIGMVVETPAPTLVVIAQSYYHNWHAFVDGKPVRLLRANHAYQALEVPAGRHEVAVVYKDHAFLAGAILSGVALLACLWISFRSRSKEQEADDPAKRIADSQT